MDWDDVVDVICAGAGPGVLAHAIACADLDLAVELADVAVPAQVDDPDTAAYLQSMTDDLGPLIPGPDDLELSGVHAEPVVVEKGRRATVEPFFGAQLRGWSARCAVSPFGIIYSHVPENMTAMRAKSGQLIRATVVGDYQPDTERPGLELTGRLRDWADERGLLEPGDTTLQRLIFEGGRVAGAALATPSGTRLVRATSGVALSTAALPDDADWPVQAGMRGIAAHVAVVSRTASRFGRVELLYGS
ncbi:hypothetical protein B1R94_03050 [Mycolicibacterium litorale]|nr:hypothetical protein B1R94_03050 [Mycolicibacterium litorale]